MDSRTITDGKIDSMAERLGAHLGALAEGEGEVVVDQFFTSG